MKSRLDEARQAFRDAKDDVWQHQMYEGQSTKTGAALYKRAWEAAAYYVHRLEEEKAVKEDAERAKHRRSGYPWD